MRFASNQIVYYILGKEELLNFYLRNLFNLAPRLYPNTKIEAQIMRPNKICQ